MLVNALLQTYLDLDPKEPTHHFKKEANLMRKEIDKACALAWPKKSLQPDRAKYARAYFDPIKGKAIVFLTECTCYKLNDPASGGGVCNHCGGAIVMR